MASRVYSVAWFFFAIASVLGLLLRTQAMHPVAGVNYAYFLHAHSHIAFLGWVFNAFFALTLRFFVKPEDVRGYGWLFLVLQVAVVGMLITYLVSGYSIWSIAFSSLHMVGAGVFAWKLWRRARACSVAGRYLRVGLVFMVVSGAGPLALGPLAACGLRETPWYSLAIYFYLHCQYNGWFMFFLQAVLFQKAHEHGVVGYERAADRAFGWLAWGCAMTFSISTLWLIPPVWVYVVAGLGAVAQIVGCGYFVRSLRGMIEGGRMEMIRVVRWLAGIALAAFLLKHVLQFCSVWPALAELMGQRFVVIGFLHLVFLGVVTPTLIAWAVSLGWMRMTRLSLAALAFFLCGAGLTEVALGYPPLAGVLGWQPWPWVQESVVVAAEIMAAGILLLTTSLRRERAAELSSSRRC